MMNTVLRAEHLKKGFGEKLAVRDVSFSVHRGEFFGLIGSNGAGKSTTMKMILGLMKPDDGAFSICAERIGYSPESPKFPGHMRGREILALYAKLQRIPKDRIKEEVQSALAFVGLKDEDTRVKHYSKGMLQKLSIAQALLGDPELLILDEPTSGLDALARHEILEKLRRLCDGGKTTLINSHVLSEVESVCDRALLMKEGVGVSVWEKGNARSLEEEFFERMEASA